MANQVNVACLASSQSLLFVNIKLFYSTSKWNPVVIAFEIFKNFSHFFDGIFNKNNF